VCVCVCVCECVCVHAFSKILLTEANVALLWYQMCACLCVCACFYHGHIGHEPDKLHAAKDEEEYVKKN
jgi:hypothetical protein